MDFVFSRVMVFQHIILVTKMVNGERKCLDPKESSHGFWAFKTFWLSNYLILELPDSRTLRFSNSVTLGLSDFWPFTFGLSNFRSQTLGLLNFQPLELWFLEISTSRTAGLLIFRPLLWVPWTLNLSDSQSLERSTSRAFDLSNFLTSKLLYSNFRPHKYGVSQTLGHSNFRSLEPSNFRTFNHSHFRTRTVCLSNIAPLKLSASRSFGFSNFGSLELWIYQTFGL